MNKSFYIVELRSVKKNGTLYSPLSLILRTVKLEFCEKQKNTGMIPSDVKLNKIAQEAVLEGKSR